MLKTLNRWIELKQQKRQRERELDGFGVGMALYYLEDKSLETLKGYLEEARDFHAFDHFDLGLEKAVEILETIAAGKPENLQSGESVGHAISCANPELTIALFTSDRVPVGTKLYTDQQPVAPGELAKELSHLYWKAYHAGHNETVEGCCLDVFYRDRLDYWGERITDIIEEGELPILKALLSAGKENKE